MGLNGRNGARGVDDHSCAYCTANSSSSSSPSLSENLFGETVCDLHVETATFGLLGMFIDDDGLGDAEGVANGVNVNDRNTDKNNWAGEEDLAKPAHHQVFAVDEESVNSASPAFLRAAAAAITIQKVWREPNVRTRCRRAYALRPGQPGRRSWAARKILVAWRRYERQVAEAAVVEAEETEAAVAIVAAVEAAEEAEAAEAAEAAGIREAAVGAAVLVLGGGESPGYDEDDGLTCAHCADRALYENLLGELVCRVHEVETFGVLYPSSASDDGAAAPNGEGARGGGGGGDGVAAAPKFQCLVCDVDMIDGGSGSDRKGGRCAFGHALCVACTTRYVKETLLPQGTVFWDRVRCVDRKCTSYMRGMSVQRSIADDEELVKRVEAGQLDAAYLVCGERDPSSQAVVTEFTRPCPNCNAATEKNGGCDHMTCTVCKHQYWYSCSCVHPNHTRECDSRR